MDKRIEEKEVGTSGACTHIYIDGVKATKESILQLIQEAKVETLEKIKTDFVTERDYDDIIGNGYDPYWVFNKEEFDEFISNLLQEEKC